MCSKIIRFDCRHIKWDRPCSFHKQEGVVCADCPHYEAITRRVMMVKLAADGDVLRTTGVVPLLRQADPGLHLTWLTAPSAVPLLANHPGIDRVIEVNRGTPPEILVEQFDLVICPDADPFSCELAALARTGQRRGFIINERGVVRPISQGAAEWLRLGLNDNLKRANKRSYQEVMGKVLELPAVPGPPELFLRPDERARALEFRRSAGIPEKGKLIGLNTGAGARWPRKCWTYEGFLGLGKALVKMGHGVLLLGGPSEEERNARLLAAGGEGFYDAGSRNPVREFAARLALCDLLVTGDTLALHIGVAMDIPVVATFGPTSLPEIELFGKGEKLAAPDMDCLCCYRGDCERQPSCQENITLATVQAAVEKWLP